MTAHYAVGYGDGLYGRPNREEGVFLPDQVYLMGYEDGVTERLREKASMPTEAQAKQYLANAVSDFFKYNQLQIGLNPLRSRPYGRAFILQDQVLQDLVSKKLEALGMKAEWITTKSKKLFFTSTRTSLKLSKA